MAKSKRKLTSSEKKMRRERKKLFQTIDMRGKQVRVRRVTTIDGQALDDFVANNADPIWLHQNEMWEVLDATENQEGDDSDCFL